MLLRLVHALVHFECSSRCGRSRPFGIGRGSSVGELVYQEQSPRSLGTIGGGGRKQGVGVEFLRRVGDAASSAALLPTMTYLLHNLPARMFLQHVLDVPDAKFLACIGDNNVV